MSIGFKLHANKSSKDSWLGNWFFYDQWRIIGRWIFVFFICFQARNIQSGILAWPICNEKLCNRKVNITRYYPDQKCNWFRSEVQILMLHDCTCRFYGHVFLNFLSDSRNSHQKILFFQINRSFINSKKSLISTLVIIFRV